MATNLIQDGEVLNWTNGSGSAVTAGTVIPLLSRCGIALVDIANASTGSVALEGVWTVPKATGATWSFGEALYWDATASKVTTTSTGNTPAGCAFAAAESGATTGRILLGVAQQTIAAPTDIATVTVSTAELLALNTTPKTLLAAPGANKAIIVAGAFLWLDYNSTAYDGIAAGEDLAIRYTNGSGQLVATIEATGFLDATADAIRYVYPISTAAITPVANAAVVLFMETGNIATGNSPLKVRLNYRIVDTIW